MRQRFAEIQRHARRSWSAVGTDAPIASPLTASLFAGLVIGLIIVFIEISLASLVFGGAFAPYVGAGIGYMLVGAFVMSLVVALRSSVAGIIAVPQDTTAALLSLVAASVAGGAAVATEENFVTVVAVMVVASLLTGALLPILGWYRLGRLVRFIPYPVIAGFLGGTGWFLLKGSFGMLTGQSLALDQAGALLQPDVIVLWLPGLAFALALRVTLGRFKHFLAMPALILITLLLFYAFVWLSGQTLEQIAALGWLLGPFNSSATWRPPTPALLLSADWMQVLDQAGTIAAIVIISTVGLLLNASALEVALKRDVKLDLELRAAGLGNLLAGLFGGPPGYLTPSLTVLGRQMGASSRLVGMVTGLTCLLALLVGTDVLALLPRFVFGGMVLHVGLVFLGDALVTTWSKLPRFDYAVVVAIIVVMAAVGVLEALLFGIVLTTILFVVEYSRVDVVRAAWSGARLRSRVQRSALEEAILRTEGDQVQVLRLQGFLFFGTSESLLNRIGRRVQADGQAPLRFLVLDFQAVRGVDVSALNSFVRLTHLAEAHHFRLLFSGLTPALGRQMASIGVIAPESNARRTLGTTFGDGPASNDLALVYPDLDQAIESCEEEILAGRRTTGETDGEIQLSELLLLMSPDAATLEAFSSAFERVQAPAGAVLVRQGDPSDVLFLVASGHMDVLLEAEDGSPLRIRSIGPGAVIGEIGYYLHQSRSATIVASQPAVLYRLTSEALARMESEAPAAAAVFHRAIARTLAERVATMNEFVQELQH